MNRLLLAAAATVLLSLACATLAPVTCGPAEFDPPARLTCDAAVAAAREQLAAVGGVMSLRVDYEGVCPPNARCRPPDGHSVAVIATLAGGDEIYVRVFIDEDGAVHAETPQPLVTPGPEPAG